MPPRKKSSRSASPAKKAAAGAPLVSADTALLATGGWWMLIFGAMLVNPAWLLTMYEMPLDDLKENNKDWVAVLMWCQNWGLWGLASAMPGFVVRRDGTTNTKCLMCAANIVSLMMFVAVGEWKFYPQCADLGMPDHGAHFNRAICVVLLVVSYLGWQDSGSVVPDASALTQPLASPSSTAACYHAYLCAFFGAMMLFNMQGLFDQYGFQQDGILAKWVTMTFTGIAQALVSIFISSACLLGADKKATAGLMRSQWGIYIMMFAAGAIGNTVNQNYTFPDMPVEGQYFNMGLWFVGAALPFKAMTGSFPMMKGGHSHGHGHAKDDHDEHAHGHDADGNCMDDSHGEKAHGHGHGKK